MYLFLGVKAVSVSTPEVGDWVTLRTDKRRFESQLINSLCKLRSFLRSPVREHLNIRSLKDWTSWYACFHETSCQDPTSFLSGRSRPVISPNVFIFDDYVIGALAQSPVSRSKQQCVNVRRVQIIDPNLAKPCSGERHRRKGLFSGDYFVHHKTLAGRPSYPRSYHKRKACTSRTLGSSVTKMWEIGPRR